MAFIALGINHKTASVEVRERVAFTPEQLVEALQQLCRLTPSREAAILSTCNRSELYLEQDQLSSDEVLQWLADYHRLSVAELRACAYVYSEEDAVRHMMRVACGLDSMVLGEPQILGQLKSAYAVAREAGTVGPLLGRLFQATFSTAKTVRTDTAIGENPVSVAFAAVSLAKQIFADLHRSQALLIGAGETISLVARHLHDQGIKRIVVANRTLERASQLAEQFGAHAVLLSDIPDELAHSDIVISSTASQLPILGKGAVESALKNAGTSRSSWSTSPCRVISSHRWASWTTFTSIPSTTCTRSSRKTSRAARARRRQPRSWWQPVPTISCCACASWPQSMCSRPIASRPSVCATRNWPRRSACWPTAAIPNVLAQLARGLTNKLLHAPSVRMKKLTAEGRVDALSLAQELFALDESAPQDKGLQ